MTPQDVLERYKKVKTLHEQATTPGEKQAAFTQMQRMEQKYPSLKQDLNKESARKNPPPPDKKDWWEVYEEQQRAKSWRGYVDQFSNAAAGAFSWASQFASAAFGLREARVLAYNHTTLKVKKNNTGSITANVRLTPEVVNHMHSVMNAERLETYCTAVAERLGNELFHKLAEELNIHVEYEESDEHP